MIDPAPDERCKKMSCIQPSDEWWFYQCVGGVPEDTTGTYGKEETEELLMHVQQVFDNRWYVKRGNRINSGICAGLLLGGVQNTIPNIMRLASNLSRLGGIAQLGRHVRDNLRNVSQCLDTILELEILGCLVEGGLRVAPYPVLDGGRRPEALVSVNGKSIYVEVTALGWPPRDSFPGVDWKHAYGTKIIQKCVAKAAQLPPTGCGAFIVNPPTLVDEEIGKFILESMKGHLDSGLYSRLSGIVLASKLIERSGLIKAMPIVLVNSNAVHRCDMELAALAEALWKHPEHPGAIC